MFVKYIVIALLSFLFASCGSGMKDMTLNKMANSSIGDPYSIYESRSNPLEYQTITGAGNDAEIKVVVYNMYLYSNPDALVSKNLTYCYVVYSFEEDKLLFWGFPEDYLRSDDKKIRDLGLKLAGIIKTARGD